MGGRSASPHCVVAKLEVAVWCLVVRRSVSWLPGARVVLCKPVAIVVGVGVPVL